MNQQHPPSTSTSADDGRLPASLADAIDVETEVWYHGFMPRDELKELLRRPGDFIVRQTELKNNAGFQLVLSVKGRDQMHHFPVYRHAPDQQQVQGHRFFVDLAGERSFPSVSVLVQHYHRTKEPIDVRVDARCLQAVPRQPWELRRDQIAYEKQLGKGAFGTVHRGTLKQLVGGEERVLPVAVKLHKSSALNKEKLQEIIAEARMLRDYDHPNIVKFHGVSVDQQPVMICMELADGGSLDKYLTKTAVSDADRLRMCVEAARGLAYLHDKKVIHRDVAARNCLVNDGHVKISDFGLAQNVNQQQQQQPDKLHHDATSKAKPSAAAAATTTKDTDDEPKMPVRWMSRESMLHGTFSPASDVYSFGVLVWEVYSDAEMPYRAHSLREVFDGVLSGKLKLDKPPRMPDNVWSVVRKGCLRSDPSKRLKMADVRDRLERLMKAHDDGGSTATASAKQRGKNSTSGTSTKEGYSVGRPVRVKNKMKSNSSQSKYKSKKDGRGKKE